jgi:aminobenzoyl-glutamate transport protein
MTKPDNSFDSETPAKRGKRGPVTLFLDGLEYVGNKLPDPAVLFLIGIVLIALLSLGLSTIEFEEIDPRSQTKSPIRIVNLFEAKSIAGFLSTMVDTFVHFHPLGVVLVAMLGVGVAEHSGFINTLLKNLLNFTPKSLLTPMVMLVGILSHAAADAGYVLVIPIGGIMFYSAGRHPLAGIAAAFAGVSGGFGANLVPSGIDPLLQGLTQEGAKIIDPNVSVNPLCNYFFCAASSFVIIVVGWILTDFFVEPRLKQTRVDGDPANIPKMADPTNREQLGMYCGIASMVVFAIIMIIWALPADSALRGPDGSLTSARPAAPLMASIVPLIFFFFVIPGIIHGYISGTFKSHRDIIKGMSKSMETMGYYLVLVFFAALFIDLFNKSNLGLLLAVKGANFLLANEFSPAVTILGVILISTTVNLLVGSASAKWAMLAPILVPMLMLTGLSPDLIQASYRVGDSSTNIITPLMPYFPLVVVFCQRYVKSSGIGTVGAMMLPYSICILLAWTAFLMLYWYLGLPLGLQSSYTYVAP